MGTLAKNVKRLRLDRKMTQEDLGAAIGVTKGHVSRIESGETQPSLARLQRLAKALRCEAADLLKS